VKVLKLTWDSVFFGYPIGKIDWRTTEKEDLQYFNKYTRPFKLVYIFSQEPIKDFEKLNLKHVDTKVTFSKRVLEYNKIYDICLEYINSKSAFKELLSLAYESGKYSRFKNDNYFVKNEFERLYEEWILKSINKDIAFKVLVEKKNDIISGFVTLGKFSETTSEIGLIAVRDEIQGTGVGSKLIKCAESTSLAKNYKFLQVSTQEENQQAMQFYIKNGFCIKEKVYIYHYWNL